MPPKKQEKTREEKAIESGPKIDASNVKTTTEKKVRERLPERLIETTEKKVKSPKKNAEKKGTVTKKSKKPTKKELEKIESFNVVKKRVKKSTKAKEYSPPKTKLREGGYELIITEKPQAALKIANALGDAVQKNINKVAYYEVKREGAKIVVACAVGHLFTLKQKSQGSQIPTFDIAWIPNFIARKKDFTKRYYDTILKLTKDAGSITIATDYDVEGEVIGMNVMKYICNQKDASRMKFSTLTPKELNTAYEKKSKSINWGHAIAGETRHYLDWFYGINLSRALMNAIKTTGKFKLMSIGRVQGPALNLIVKKEREIQKFKSEPYWQVFIKIKENPFELWLKHNKDLFDKKELKNFENLIGKKVNCSTKKRTEIVPPNPPFNLTTLQTEAYKFHGITPSATLRSAQSLYLAGLISYPRTSSQKLPEEIGYKDILKQLAKEYKVEKLIKRDKPVEGEKTDPAHPSIYPTGQKQALSGDDDKIYKLIVKRFLSLFCEDAEIDHKTISAEVDEFKFGLKGQVIKKKAWMEIYPSKLKEEKIPDVNGEKEILDMRIDEKETQPPKRFSPASIISELEKKNLGTKATRSNILETLYDRGYVEGQSIKATDLGISLIETMEKYSPIIIDEELTRDFEEEMEKITSETSKTKQEAEEDHIIERAKKTITEIAKDFEKSKTKIGSELIDANIKFRERQKIENQLIKCPKCNKGELMINYSKKNGRFFVSCNAYPDCTNTYTLPPNGQIKKTEKTCEECKYPMLMRLSKGKKPWIFCWNPACPTNSDWVKRRDENAENVKKEEETTTKK